MRRLAHLLAVGLLTFLLGVACVRGYGRLLGLVPAIEEALVPAPPVEVSLLTPDPMGRVTDGLRVTFVRIEQYDARAYAEFIITNESPQPVHYIHFGDWIGEAVYSRQRGVTSPIVRGCSWGLSGATMKPGESARFAARIPDKRAPFEVAFKLFVEKGGPGDVESKTVWSEAIHPRAR